VAISSQAELIIMLAIIAVEAIAIVLLIFSGWVMNHEVWNC